MSRGSELYFEQQKSITQFAYFQLGVAASAIAFAVHQTSGRSLDETPWPIGVAVVCWALSFFFGTVAIEHRIVGIGGNTRLLFMREELNPIERKIFDQHPEFEKWKGEINVALQKPSRYFRLQRWMIFAGAIAYVSGHVMDMVAVNS